MHDNFELIADYASYVAVPRNAQKVTKLSLIQHQGTHRGIREH